MKHNEMSGKSSFFGKMLSKTHRKTIEVKVDVLEYEGNNMFYVYSPALDLVGYGKNPDEARNSWETVIAEFIKYGLNKNTLFDDLKAHGWTVKNKTHINPPTLSWLLQNNEDLSEMYNNHDFKKVSRQVNMPACA